MSSKHTGETPVEAHYSGQNEYYNNIKLNKSIIVFV